MTSSHACELAREEQELDLTPLIDCFLLLIIFFACLEFRSLEAKLPAYLPKTVGQGLTQAAPEETLAVRIVGTAWGTEVPRDPARAQPYRLVGHEVAWQVGAKRCAALADLQAELDRLARERSARGAERLPVVLEPQRGTTFGDVATTLDAVLAAGFGEVRFGGGAGERRGQAGR